MKKIILLSLALILMLPACGRPKVYPQPPAYHPHPAGEFPLIAGYTFYHPYMTDQQMQWVKEAGFNTVIKSLPIEDTDSLLRLASKYDMHAMIMPWGIRNEKTRKNRVERYKDHPMVWGFSLGDEPNASQFQDLRTLQDDVLKYAPAKTTFINLLGVSSPEHLGSPDYRTHVEDFIETVNPPFLSFDVYPVRKRGNGEIYVEPIIYETLEIMREMSQESGRPFWSYVLSNKHKIYPKPKEEYIRFQVFTSLAYGAQGLSYFTYLMPDFDKDVWRFSDAPIDWNGKRTKTWEMVRNVNREVRNLTPVFLGAEAVDVSMTGYEIPKENKRTIHLPEPFVGIESGSDGVVVSHLKNGNAEYLLLVNRDVTAKQKVRLSRRRGLARLYGDGTEKVEIEPTITLSPGGYALYRL